jgi:sugar-specific transcriptional regulator TrmB
MIRNRAATSLLLCLSLGACGQDPVEERYSASQPTVLIDLEQQETRQRLERIEARLDALEAEAAPPRAPALPMDENSDSVR